MEPVTKKSKRGKTSARASRRGQATKAIQKEHISEDLRPLTTAIADLHADPANVRRHSQRNIDTIKASLAKFGQRTPIVVQRDGMTVRKGNGTVEAAKALGWSHVAALVLDDDNTTASAYAIADNRTAELAEWDGEGLSQLLDSLDADLVDATGFSPDEIDSLVQSLESPSESDWAAQFEADGDTSEVDGMAQITFVLGVDDMARLKGILKTHDPNKNKAMALWLASS